MEESLNNIYSFKHILENKQSYAKLFAHQDEDLYNLLMLCFDHNIEIIQCGKGEKIQNEIKKPYIKLRMNHANEKYIYNIINQIKKDDTIITFSLNHIGQKAVTFKSLKEGRRFFKEIEDVILKDAVKIDKDIINIYRFVQKAQGRNIDIKLFCDDGKVRYYIKTNDQSALTHVEKHLFPNLGKIV